MKNFKNFQSALNEATVNVELKRSAHERELLWLQKWAGVKATLNLDLGNNRHEITFKNNNDGQRYAKILKDSSITKSVNYNA